MSVLKIDVRRRTGRETAMGSAAGVVEIRFTGRRQLCREEQFLRVYRNKHTKAELNDCWVLAPPYLYSNGFEDSTRVVSERISGQRSLRPGWAPDLDLRGDDYERP